MATRKQKLALSKIVENRGGIGRAMREVGYTKASAKNPKNLTESKGFKALLKESGLDEDLVVSALVEDIKKKRFNRVQELKLGADLLGMVKKKPEELDKEPLTIQIISYADLQKQNNV
jgi:hypothetical protein